MEGLEGKKIIVFYDDLGKVSRKDGQCGRDNSTELEINKKIIIPKARIIRIEIIDK